MEKLSRESRKIHELARRCARDYLDAEGRLLLALVDVDRDKTYEGFEITFLTPYCVKILELSESTAATLVRVVRKSHHVPELATAVAKREISLSNAKIIASVITPENKDEWLLKAKVLSKAKLEKTVATASGLTTKLFSLDMPLDDHDLFNRAVEVLTNKRGEMMSRVETQHWMMVEVLDRYDPVRIANRPRGQCRSVKMCA